MAADNLIHVTLGVPTLMLLAERIVGSIRSWRAGNNGNLPVNGNGCKAKDSVTPALSILDKIATAQQQMAATQAQQAQILQQLLINSELLKQLEQMKHYQGPG